MSLSLKDLFAVDLATSASLCLVDLGAQVIKIEPSNIVDLCRHSNISNFLIDDQSVLFKPSIACNKGSYAANLKNPQEKVVELIKKADVLIQNFRPSIMQKLKLSYEYLKTPNP